MARLAIEANVRVLAVAAAVLIACAAARGGETPSGRVWERYLGPAERKAMAALYGMAQPNPPADATPGEILDGARKGFDSLIRSFGPARRGQIEEPYSKDGVSGLWIRPKDGDRDRVLLYLHGGGFVVGSAATGAPVAGYLAEEAEILAFSLDYPLAPESPYPAQLDNAEAAYAMLVADMGFKPENIVVAGDSAGGNLALALLMRLRENTGPLPAAVYLISPWGDVGHSLPTHTLKKDVDRVLDDNLKEWFASLYAPGQDRKYSRISPVYYDGMAGFPPILIQVGSFETLLDDSLTLARNAALADVPVRLSVWPGYGHDFQLFFPRLAGAEKALDEAAEFLEDALDGTLLSDD